MNPVKFREVVSISLPEWPCCILLPLGEVVKPAENVLQAFAV
jgi:hypothetical protein